YNLNYRLAIPMEAVLTENLASWYDGVRDNKKCVATVILNDPTFAYRDINLVLSDGAEKLIGNDVTYVTVNVRKTRSDGSKFQGRATIDQDYLKKNGMKATFTYSRGTDQNSDLYEYQTQWSFNDGEVYPTDPSPWIKGTWEAVALNLPVKPRTIE